MLMTKNHSHGQVWCWYPFYNSSYPNPTMLTHNETFAAEAWDDYWTYHTGPLTSGAIDGVVSSTTIRAFNEIFY